MLDDINRVQLPCTLFDIIPPLSSKKQCEYELFTRMGVCLLLSFIASTCTSGGCFPRARLQPPCPGKGYANVVRKGRF